MDASRSNPPFFSAMEPRAWTTNRNYRVFVSADELVAVWAGSGNDVAMAMTAGGGLAGGLLAAAVNPARKNARRGQELDSKPLVELRKDHKHNFAWRLDEIDEAEIVPAGFWFRVNYATVPAMALLRLRSRDGERRTLALASNHEVRQAVNLLQGSLGSRLQVRAPPVFKNNFSPVRTPPSPPALKPIDDFESYQSEPEPESARHQSGLKIAITGAVILAVLLGLVAIAVAWGVLQRGWMPEDNWKALQSSPGHFQILFPEVPQSRHETTARPAGSVDIATFEKEYNHPEITFTASYYDLTPQALRDFSIERRFHDERERARARIQGEVLSEHEIQLGHSPGREWHIKGRTTGVVIRMYAIPDAESMRIFILSVAGPDVSPATPAAGRFLNSFRFDLKDLSDARPMADSRWKPFSSPPGGFQILFPGQPEFQEREVAFAIGNVTRFAYVTNFSNPAVSFWADYMDIAPDIARRCPPENCFEYLKSRMLSQFRGGQVISEKSLRLGNHPGMEFALAGGGTQVAARIYSVPAGEKTRLFLLMVRGVNVRPAAADVARFFDSFAYNPK